MKENHEQIKGRSSGSVAGKKRDGSPRRSDTGSSLILALVYIVAIGMIIGALADWAMNDLGNTTRFQSAATVHDAVSGATEVAIQSIRYYPEYPQTESPTYNTCFSPASGSNASDVQINGTWVAVWCSTVANPTSQNTRIVTFVACTESSGTVANNAMATCEASPYLKAVVTFGDYPSGGGGLQTSVCSGGQNVCGFSATTNQWSWA
jgi:hypothetical protein